MHFFSNPIVFYFNKSPNQTAFLVTLGSVSDFMGMQPQRHADVAKCLYTSVCTPETGISPVQTSLLFPVVQQAATRFYSLASSCLVEHITEPRGQRSGLWNGIEQPLVWVNPQGLLFSPRLDQSARCLSPSCLLPQISMLRAERGGGIVLASVQTPARQNVPCFGNMLEVPLLEWMTARKSQVRLPCPGSARTEWKITQ